MQQDGIIPEPVIQIPKGTVEARNFKCSSKLSFGDQTRLGHRDVFSNSQADRNYDFCSESEGRDDDSGLKEKPVYREVLIDGFSILSFKTENDLLLYSKQKEAERWNFASTCEVKTKRPYRHRKERRSKNAAKHSLNCEPVRDMTGSGAVVDEDKAVASSNASLADPEHIAFRTSSHLLTNGSPDGAGGLRPPPALVPAPTVMSNGATLIPPPPLPTTTTTAGSNIKLPDRCLLDEGRNHSAETGLMMDTLGGTIVSLRSRGLERSPTKAAAAAQSVQCTAFTAMERPVTTNSGNSTGPHAYANHHGEAGSQARTPLKGQPSNPVVEPGNPSGVLLQKQQQQQQSGLASGGAIDPRTLNKWWPSSLQEFPSPPSSSTTSAHPVEHPPPLTSASESTHHAERPRANRTSAHGGRRKTENATGNSSSVNGASGQCRSFTVAALANEQTNSLSRSEEAARRGPDSCSPHKNRGQSRRQHPSETGVEPGPRWPSGGRQSPRGTQGGSRAAQTSPASGGDAGKDRGRATNPSLAAQQPMNTSTLLESSISAQQLHNQYNSNCYHRDAGGPAHVPVSSQPCPSRPFPDPLGDGGHAGRRQKVPPAFSDAQLFHQLMHGDADMAKRLANDTRFATDPYTLTLLEASRSPVTKEATRIFNPPLASVPIGEQGRGTQKQLRVSLATSSAPVSSVNANVSPSFGHVKRTPPDLGNYTQQPQANRPRISVHYQTSNPSPSLPSHTTTGSSRLNRVGAGLSRSTHVVTGATAAVGPQHSQDLISAAYCDRNLIDRVPPMLGGISRADAPWLTSSSASPYQFLPTSAGQPSTSRVKVVSPRSVAATSRDPLEDASRGGMPPPLYAWFQRPMAPGEAAVPTANTSNTSIAAGIGLPMQRPTLPNQLSLQHQHLLLQQQQQPAPHAFGQNPVSCSPAYGGPVVPSEQPLKEAWDAYLRRLINECSALGPSYDPVSTSSSILTTGNRTNQPLGSLSNPLLLTPETAATGKPVPAHLSLIQSLLSGGEHLFVSPGAAQQTAQQQRQALLHHQQQKQQLSSDGSLHVTASQATGGHVGSSEGHNSSQRSHHQQQQPFLTALNRPAFSDRTCGRWADAHIRIARFIHVKRHQGPPGYADKLEAITARPLETGSHRGSQPIRPIAHSAMPLLWPGTLPVPTVASQLVPQPPPALAVQPQQRPQPEQAQQQQSLAAAHQQLRTWPTQPPVVTSSVAGAGAVPPLLLQPGSLDQGMSFLNQIFGGLLDHYLQAQTASASAAVPVKSAVDMPIWRSALNHFYQQSVLDQPMPAPVVQPSTSAYLLADDASNNRQPQQLPLFYSHHQPFNVSMAPNATAMNLIPAEVSANNSSSSAKPGVSTSKRRRLEVSPGVGSVGEDAALFNSLFLQQQQARDPRLIAGGRTGALGTPAVIKTVNTNPTAGGLLNGYHLPGGFRQLRPQAAVGGPTLATCASTGNPLPLPIDIGGQLAAMAASVRSAPTTAAVQHGILDGGLPTAVPPHLPQRQLGVIPPR